MMSGLSLDKVRIALTLLSIAIIVGPLIGLLYVYRDNVVGLIVPPQLKNLLSGGDSSGSQSSQLLPNFQMPQPVGQPQYNNVTGAFVYQLNVTNPLTTQLSLSQLSAEVVGGNNVTLGTVSAQPISLAPGASAIINITGNLNQNEIKQLTAQNSSGTNLNVSLENVNVDVGGIKVHFNQLNNVGSIPTG
jgi:hypothetical protein